MITKWMNHLRKQGGLHKEKQEHNNGSWMAKPKTSQRQSTPSFLNSFCNSRQSLSLTETNNTYPLSFSNFRVNLLPFLLHSQASFLLQKPKSKGDSPFLFLLFSANPFFCQPFLLLGSLSFLKEKAPFFFPPSDA